MTRHANAALRPSADSAEELIGELLPTECDEDFDACSHAELIDWLYWAGQLPGKTALQTAILIAESAISCGRLTGILLTPAKLDEHDLVRETFSRALTSLERSELVTACRHHGLSPIVSILLPQTQDDEADSVE